MSRKVNIKKAYLTFQETEIWHTLCAKLSLSYYGELALSGQCDLN